MAAAAHGSGERTEAGEFVRHRGTLRKKGHLEEGKNVVSAKCAGYYSYRDRALGCCLGDQPNEIFIFSKPVVWGNAVEKNADVPDQILCSSLCSNKPNVPPIRGR